VIVSGNPKGEIQVKAKAFAHAAVDVSDGRTINNSKNIIKIITVLQRPTKST
jgi:hypothetical protein